MKISIFILLFSLSLFPNSFNKDQYYRYLGSLSALTCSPNDLQKYNKLKEEFRDTGFYVPYRTGLVDKEALRRNQNLLKEKITWINKLSQRLSRNLKKEDITFTLESMQNSIDKNLELKYKKEIKFQYGVKLVNSAKNSIDNIKKSFYELEDKLFYLFGFSYPVNHLQNRAVYEDFKAKKDYLNKNISFVRRKILEDGVSTGRGRDTLFRTSLDTIRLKLNKTFVFLDDDLRYDLEWLIGQLKKKKKYSNKRQYLSGIKKWRIKSQEQFDFYNKLIFSPHKKEKKDKSFSVEKFKDFVYGQEGKVYSYLATLPDIYRKAYLLETMLYNEVGSLDPDGIDKYDVLKTFFNRTITSPFNNLSSNDSIYKHIKGLNTSKYPWSNTLFRTGEYSFTYHYISSVKNIFCPPMSDWSNALRDKNLKISVDFINSHNADRDKQKPFYYFSRVSMLGRINMAEIWHKNNDSLSTIVGKKIYNAALSEKIKNENFRYLFKFKQSGSEYMAIDIQKENYVVELVSKQIYSFRDPNIFKFFARRKP